MIIPIGDIKDYAAAARAFADELDNFITGLGDVEEFDTGSNPIPPPPPPPPY